MAKLVVADLEALFTANTQDIERADKQIVAIGKKVESNPIKLGADAKGALGSMDRVEKAAKKLVSERAILKLDADISRAETNLGKAINRLEDLHIAAEGGIDVTADVKRAEASIQRFERQLEGLKRARNVVDVEVEPEQAESSLKRFLSLFKSRTEEAGREGGKSLSQGLDAATRGAGQKVGDVVGGDIEKTLVDALSAIPIAGGIILAGVAIGKAVTGAIQDGLAVEKNTDRLQGLTGISEADALRLGRASGEAYANNFGESIESNMDATRLALQFRIIDPSATTRDAQLVVQGLAGIADVLGEDVEPVARAVTQMLRTGLVSSAQQAFDVIAAGAREGVNIGGDLLDTFNEYGTQFRKLGLDGPQALGLLSQGLRAGARDSDVAADALKEFAIRAVDPAMKQGFEEVGFSWDDLSQRIAQGGPVAAAALDETLDRIREMPDPAEQAAAAVALFGTQSEDMAAALLSMDLSTAVDQLGGVQGAAQKMFDTLAGNDASKIEQAQRNIEVAADGIKGALASAFSEPLGDLADFVSQNRGPVLEFFRDMTVGALDFAITASDGVGDFVSGPLADMVESFVAFLKITNFDPFKDFTDLDNLVAGMKDFDASTDSVTANLQNAKSELTDFADPLIALGYVNDAALRTASAVSAVGVAADGSALSMAGLDTANLTASESGRALKEQLDGAASSLLSEYEAALLAGESQANLQDRYVATRDALMGQLTAMGLSTEAAQALIDTVLKTPEQSYTVYSSNAEAQAAIVDSLTQKVIQLPDGSFAVVADTSQAMAALAAIPRDIKVNVSTFYGGGVNVNPNLFNAEGRIVEFMAEGGIRGTPMSPLATMVPASTYRIVGDRGDVPEAYIPLDGSPRSIALLMETIQRMPGLSPMGVGGTTATAGPSAPSGAVVNQYIYPVQTDPRLQIRQWGREAERGFASS